MGSSGWEHTQGLGDSSSPSPSSTGFLALAAAAMTLAAACLLRQLFLSHVPSRWYCLRKGPGQPDQGQHSHELAVRLQPVAASKMIQDPFSEMEKAK